MRSITIDFGRDATPPDRFWVRTIECRWFRIRIAEDQVNNEMVRRRKEIDRLAKKIERHLANLYEEAKRRREGK